MSDEDDLVRGSWGRDAQVSVQAKPDFWGWYIQENQSTQALVCLGTSEAFRYTNTYGGCCPEVSTTTCSFATACTRSVIRYIGGASGTCNPGYECVTISIVHPGQEPSPTMQFVCGNTVAMSYTRIWRQLPAETTTSEVTSTSSLPLSTASETNPATTTDEPLPSSTEGTENGDGAGSSMGWIAGAVVGPLFLIIAVALGIWWLRRRSAKKAAALQQAEAQGSAPAMAPHPGWAPSPPYLQQPKPPSPYYQDAHGNMQWVDNRYSVAEMPSTSPPPPQELPSSPQQP